jgi:hypothetical protein
MSTLAFTAQGSSFDVPETATDWRVRRLRPRGAPETVYGPDGLPLTVPIESDVAILRDAVGGVLGRYRLDSLDEEGKQIDGVPAAYVQVVEAAPAPAPLPPPSGPHAVLQEAMRLNTELAKAMIERFPDMLRASAELLRAADGAGLPARQRCAADDHAADDNADDEQDAERSSTLATLLSPVVDALTSALVAPASEETTTETKST